MALLQFLFLTLISFKSHSSFSNTYLIWDNPDTAHTISINYSSLENVKSAQIFFDTKSHQTIGEYAHSQKLTSQNSIPQTPISILTFSLKNLTANTTYYFRLQDDIHKLSEEFKFKTLPEDNSPLEIVNGGDMSPHGDIPILAKQAITNSTSTILIGGDLAYENGDLKNYKLWLSWFDYLKTSIRTPDGRLIPMIIAIGNHEVNKRKSKNNLDRAPFYLHFFKQSDNKSYFLRHLGSQTTVFALDTNHLTSHHGEQLAWLKTQLKSEESKPHKMAIYHVPLYPSFRQDSDSASQLGRQHWAPLFDQYHLRLALEHHDHALKRTHILRNNKVVENDGTVYIGDGCWAVAPRPVTSSRWYLKTAKVEKHLWRIEINKESMQINAIGRNGQKLDSFLLEKDKVKSN